MKAPFKQRENIEMYLKACAAYGLKEQDLFQVLLIFFIDPTQDKTDKEGSIKAESVPSIRESPFLANFKLNNFSYLVLRLRSVLDTPIFSKNKPNQNSLFIYQIKKIIFQVNDLYENKNLYMVVDNLYNLGGMVSLDIEFHFICPSIDMYTFYASTFI